MNQAFSSSSQAATTPASAPSISVLIADHGLSFGGTVVVAAMLMRHLDGQQVRTCFVTAAADGFTNARLAGEFDVHFAGPKFSYAGESRLKERLASIRHAGVRRALNHLGSAVGNLFNIGYVWRLFRLARSRNVQVIHCNNSVNAEAVLVAMLLRLPCVFHVHGLGNGGRIGRFLAARVRRRFVAISRAVQENIVHHGIPPADVSLIYNPVELPKKLPGELAELRESERRALGLNDNTVLVGIVGRVVRWKGQAEFLQACRLAFASCDSLQAVIVGDASDLGDDYFAALQASVQESGFAHRVHFRGFVDDPDRIYAALDIMVHSSIEPEPFGLVITEAMVRGLPVIVANTGAPPELVDHEVTGFIENPLEVDRVAARLVQLAQDATLRETMGKAGREVVLARHDAHEYAQQMTAVYRSLVSAS